MLIYIFLGRTRYIFHGTIQHTCTESAVKHQQRTSLLMSQLLSWYQMLLVDFRSVTSHLMSNDVLGLVASNIGIKDLIQSAVCAVLLGFLSGASCC